VVDVEAVYNEGDSASTCHIKRNPGAGTPGLPIAIMATGDDVGMIGLSVPNVNGCQRGALPKPVGYKGDGRA
jgi:hypothetical protein